MINEILRLGTYMASLVAVMVGLSCVNFEKFILKNKVAHFYVLYVVIVMALTYLVANLFLDVLSIKIW